MDSLPLNTPAAVLLFPAPAVLPIQIFVSLFLAILFLQSGFDKIADRGGNLSWLQSHFAKSPLARHVPVLLLIITIFEVAAGILSALGCLLIIIFGNSSTAYFGAVLSTVSITALFFGQRMAKDYAGAAVLVPYFLLSLVAIYVLAPS
jgi:uncharacterized membrane protein YphA (DoxX/SURF4 family)